MSFPAKFLILIFSAVFLTACSLLPAKREETVTLKFWGLWESASSMDKIKNDYKKIKPNTNVVYEKRSIQQYRESLEKQIQDGKGPDVFYFHNTWTPMLKEELSPIPSSVISQSDFKKNFYPIVFYDLRNPAK